MANTHYAVLTFSGDPDSEHPDDELRGHSPQLTLIAAGDEDFCWGSLARWTEKHPLRMWEEAEVLERHATVVRCPTCGGSGLVWHGTSSKRRGRVNEDNEPCMAAFACPTCPDDGSGNSKGTGVVPRSHVPDPT